MKVHPKNVGSARPRAAEAYAREGRRFSCMLRSEKDEMLERLNAPVRRWNLLDNGAGGNFLSEGGTMYFLP